MLLVFRATSNQDGDCGRQTARFRRASSRFGCSTTTFGRCFVRKVDILRHNLTYMRLSLAPMLWMIVPLVLAHRPVAVLLRLRRPRARTRRAVVKVALKEGAFDRLSPCARARGAAGCASKRRWSGFPSEREAAWRVAAEQPGDYQFTVTLDGRSVTKQFRVSDRVGWRTPERLEAAWSESAAVSGRGTDRRGRAD